MKKTEETRIIANFDSNSLLPAHSWTRQFLCFQTNVQKSNISIHEQRMKHPGHSQTACVHSKHIGIGNEDTGNDHGAGKTKYNKSVPFLALKTNMLFDIALIPNIEVEVLLANVGRSTAN